MKILLQFIPFLKTTFPILGYCPKWLYPILQWNFFVKRVIIDPLNPVFHRYSDRVASVIEFFVCVSVCSGQIF